MPGKFWPLLLLAGCATGPILPAPQRLQPWTTTLRDAQPDDAFAAVYRVRGRHLVFIAAKHENRLDSLTFRLIREAYSSFAIDSVIVEGSPTSRGPNSTRLIDYAENSSVRDGEVEAGETVPAVLGARSEGATVWGGEADDRDIGARILAQGFSGEDLLGFYVLRNIPQWMGERRIVDAGDQRLAALVDAALVRNRETLELSPNILPGFAEWARWYQSLNGKPIAADFVTEEVGPLTDGRFGTNRIAAAISRSRDAYLHELIVTRLNAGETVLVVFGGSHLMIHRPALDAVLGSPCYLGSGLAAAPASCR